MVGYRTQRVTATLVWACLLVAHPATAKPLRTDPIPEELGGAHGPTVHAVPPKVSGSILLGVGAVSLALGTWSGVRAISLVGDASSYCGEDIYDDVCGPKGLALRDEARTYAGLSTGAIVAGCASTFFGILVVSLASGNWRSVTEPPSTLSLRAQPAADGAIVVMEGLF